MRINGSIIVLFILLVALFIGMLPKHEVAYIFIILGIVTILGTAVIVLIKILSSK